MVLVGNLAAMGGCLREPRHACDDGDDLACPGRCVLGGCAFADPSCAAGVRWEDEAPEGGICVPDHFGPFAYALANGGAAVDLAGITAAVELPAGRATIDTTTGAITREGATVRGPGQGVVDGVSFTIVASGVAALASPRFVVAAGADVRVIGDNALILIATDEVDVAGTIDLGATAPPFGGPGGGRGGVASQPATGCGPGSQPVGPGGGSGGANATWGGVGAVTVLPGDPTMCASPLAEPLVGGSGGGAGNNGLAAGGGGGGALQISAGRAIRIHGVIDVGGGGGAGTAMGGGGGGAGGTILLQAPLVELAGARLAANGGGGGGGGASATAGADGPVGTATASGGASGGGAGSSSGTNGGNATDATQLGGGGGGAGVIRIETLAGTPVGEPAFISPWRPLGAVDSPPTFGRILLR